MSLAPRSSSLFSPAIGGKPREARRATKQREKAGKSYQTSLFKLDQFKLLVPEGDQLKQGAQAQRYPQRSRSTSKKSGAAEQASLGFPGTLPPFYLQSQISPFPQDKSGQSLDTVFSQGIQSFNVRFQTVDKSQQKAATELALDFGGESPGGDTTSPDCHIPRKSQQLFNGPITHRPTEAVSRSRPDPQARPGSTGQDPQ